MSRFIITDRTRSTTTREERDSLRFNKEYFWKGIGHCHDCNDKISRRAIRCRICNAKRLHTPNQR